MQKMMIEAAINELATKEQNPHVPYGPEEVAEDAIACAKAGAAIVHFHARDAQTGGAAVDQRGHLQGSDQADPQGMRRHHLPDLSRPAVEGGADRPRPGARARPRDSPGARHLGMWALPTTAGSTPGPGSSSGMLLMSTRIKR